MNDPIDYTFTALTLWREARGECEQAKRAVYWVIRNRMADGRWPSTAYGVCTQPAQFSCYNHDDPNAALWPNPRQSADWKAWLECRRIVDNPGADPTKGANHYEATPNWKPKPKWAIPARQVAHIGGHRFYKL